MAISGDLGDGAFVGDGVEREGESGGDEAGEVETVGEVFAREEEVDLDMVVRTRSVRAP